MSRYVIIPGEVISKTDGQRHFIGVGQLRHLYRVPPNAHVFVLDRRTRLGFRSLPDDIVCRPRHNGDYPR